MCTAMPGPTGTLPALLQVARVLPHPCEKPLSLLVSRGFHTGSSILLASSIRMPSTGQLQVATAPCSRSGVRATRGGTRHLCSSDRRRRPHLGREGFIK